MGMGQVGFIRSAMAQVRDFLVRVEGSGFLKTYISVFTILIGTSS